MPEYEMQAKVLHARGKLMSVHMDGRLNVLTDRIGRPPIDIIEALHPPPMGDLWISSSPGARRGPGDQDGAWRARGKRILLSTAGGTKEEITLQNVRGMIEAARSDSGALPSPG